MFSSPTLECVLTINGNVKLVKSGRDNLAICTKTCFLNVVLHFVEY